MDHALNPGRSPLRSRRVWLLAFTIWTLPVLVFSIIPVILQPDPTPRRALEMLLRQGVVWYLWAFFTPVILELSRRWPMLPGLYRRSLARHLGTGALMGAMFNVAFMVMSYLHRPEEWPAEATLPRVLITGLAVWLPFAYMVYALIASVGTSFEYYRRLRDREITTSRLEARLMEAQLSALRMQLQPHFLFNALNTVAMLVRQGDTRTSVRMLARLSELLRHVLDESGEPEIRLEQELLLVQRYLEIEQLRFGDRMSFECDVAPDVATALVPNLLLQPIVENAVRHGISRRAAAGRIAVRAVRDGERVSIEVSDDGPGLNGDVAGAPGIGLRNTRARLEHLYGERASLRIENGRGAGVCVRIELPYHMADERQRVENHG